MKKILMLMVLMLFVVGCTSYVNVSPVPEYHKITVSGQAEFETMPDLAMFDVQVESRSSTAAGAAGINAEKIDDIKDALVDAGIKSSDIETTSYNVYPWKRYEPKTGKEILEGYKAYHTLRVETDDFEDLGDYIDAAVKSGATNVQSIRFTFSKTKQREVNDEALKLAVSNAREKAESLAKTAGVNVGRIIAISESNFQSYGGYAPRAMAAMDEGGQMAKTDISPREVSTSATVEVVFMIE